MADFINTIDALGDDVVTDSIIQRTITEFKDNVLNRVSQCAFYGCTSLETVELPNVTVIESQAFSECTSLTSISIPCATSLGSRFLLKTAVKSICIPCVKNIRLSQSFRDATSLELVDAPILESFDGTDMWYMNKVTTLILRNTEKVCTLSGNAEYGKKCYTYVPKTMADGSDGVEAYKAASNWSTRADMIRAIEDYPEITGG